MDQPMTKRLLRIAGVAAILATGIAWNARDGAAAPIAALSAAGAEIAWAAKQDGVPPDRDRLGEWDEAEDERGSVERPVAHLRRLTNEEVQRIRYLELRSLRHSSNQPDRVTVKIPRRTVDEFLLEMEGHPDFRGEATRREFRKLTPAQKLHYIALYQGEAFIEKVEILSDPEAFVEFRKNVMPIVLRGCATTGCHSPNYHDDARFGLFRDPKKIASTTYANFIMLNEVTVNGEPLINRAQPENSLLLTYMLPDKEVRPTMRHPGRSGVRPIYQTRGAPGYRRIEKWIASLRQPAPNYGVSFFDEGPTSLPGEAHDGPDEHDDEGAR